MSVAPPRPERVTLATPVARAAPEQFRMRVAAVADLGGGMRRVTFEAPELMAFRPVGPDEYFGLMMPRPDRPLVLPGPSGGNVRAVIADLPEEQRPDLRWYTIRRHDPARGRMDVDIVTHGDAGPGSAWTCRARPGDEVGFHCGGALWRGGDTDARKLLVADETALPSVAGILDVAGGPDAVRRGDLEVHVEVADPAVLAGYDLGPAHVHVRRHTPGSAVLPALRERLADLVDVGYAWACGEADLAADVRRLLVREAGMDKRDVLFCSYWKLGQPRG
ncbi:siderophore-interacting protein [Phycicoccus sp. BSK3Z-2]|uniref:Siderophore-interacting protein n=1 Tax=Phycicoccus avicenniae TaxID=2828860 RepID=A0A941D8U9_9MICO|nr:siderophore-interacting protein [Phycicoccus avicenniae]MBR7744239.1 siderophore-interacting protein [Phycicoccus avicenniae]